MTALLMSDCANKDRKKQIIDNAPAVTGAVMIASASAMHMATAGTPAPPEAIAEGVGVAIATINELDGLAIAALTVALTPLAAMLTLRFLNMVLSRV